MEKKGNTLATLPLYAAMIAANYLVREPLVVRQSDTPQRKFLMAFPSAFVASKATNNRLVDTISAVSIAALSIETSRNVRNAKELAFTAIASHGAACAINAGVDRLGWLSEEERDQEDVGP